MRNTDPSDHPTSNLEETRQKLLQGALACAEKFGLDKVNFKRVAEEAGVTRQTVYRYFPTREDLLAATSFAVGGNLISQLQAHLAHHTGFADKVVESILFLSRQIPDDPFLSQYFSALPQHEPNRQQVMGPATLEYVFHALKSMYGETSISEKEERWLRGLAEHSLRTVLTLILTPSEQTRTEQGLRDYLNLWFKPLLVPPGNRLYHADK